MVGTSPASTNQSRIGSGSSSVPSRRIQSRGPMPYTSAMDATAQPFIALAQVVMIDIALAGDNAIVVGLAASRVAAAMREAASPTTIALSPASAMSIITTWASAMKG